MMQFVSHFFLVSFSLTDESSEVLYTLRPQLVNLKHTSFYLSFLQRDSTVFSVANKIEAVTITQSLNFLSDIDCDIPYQNGYIKNH